MLANANASFGVMPVHKTRVSSWTLVQPLDEPFWVIDSRDYQITSPNTDDNSPNGRSFIVHRKERPLIPLERAVMAIRFNNEIIGTQFHPELTTTGMFMYLSRTEKKIW